MLWVMNAQILFTRCNVLLDFFFFSFLDGLEMWSDIGFKC